MFALLSCATVTHRADEIVLCSLVNLIATPERYEGKRVRTEGWATIGFESDAVFLSSEDARSHSINGVRLALHDAPITEHERLALRGRRVLVEGSFMRRAHERHGVIYKISRIYPLDEDSESTK
jgi:hypothetical protein